MTKAANDVETTKEPAEGKPWVYAPALLFAVLVALGFGVMYLLYSGMNERLADSERKSRVLSDQVREMGGVPRVTVAPGPAGSPGTPGSSGQRSPASAQGATGKTGHPGITVTGPRGRSGAVGPAGASVISPPGSAGAAGPTGPAGPAGKDGKDGADGKDGSPPSSFSWTYLGITYRCTPTSDGSTTYECQPS